MIATPDSACHAPLASVPEDLLGHGSGWRPDPVATTCPSRCGQYGVSDNVPTAWQREPSGG